MKIAQTSLSAVLSFTVGSGAMRVSDPCYDMDTWCAGTLENVLNGRWNAQVAYFKDPDDHIHFLKYIEHERKEIEARKEIFLKHSNMSDEAAFNSLSEEEQQKIRDCLARIDELFKAEHARLDKRVEESKTHPGRPSAIFVWHESVNNDELPTEESDIPVGVDAGQAGFYDLAEFIKSKDSEQAYDAICANSLSDAAWGVVPYAAVSSSGYGDGGYTCYYRRNDEGKVIQAMIVFITEEDVADEEPVIEETDDGEAA